MMGSIGSILRAERERRELSVQDVFEYTKISESNVEALETDQFEAFPNKVYARAFLRDYANFLNLDSAALLQRYEAEWCAVAASEQMPPSGKTQKDSPSYLSWWILVLIILAAGYYVWSQYYNTEHTPEPELVFDVPKVPLSEHSPAPVTKPVPETPKVDERVPVEPEPESVAAPEQIPQPTPVLPVPEQMTLSVTANTNVWIRVTVDGSVVFQQELGAGQTKTWKGKDKFVVRSGMINAVKVKLNGNIVNLKPVSKSRVPIGEAQFTKADLPKH